jgi:hypothetical protein
MTEAEFKKIQLRVKNRKKHQELKKHKERKRATFILLWPPSVNQMYATTKNGKRILSKKALQFYKDCEPYFLIQKVPHFYEKVTMLIEFFPNRGGIWDASNFFKATEDVLVKNQIIQDDNVKYLQPLAPVIHKKIDNRFIKITLEEI